MAMHRGSCLCARVRYQIAGPVTRTSHCYCTMCQKQHGAAFATYANVRSADFSYTQGADAVAVFASSPGVERGFCRVCGSNLTWQAAAHADRIGVTLGTFDTPYTGTGHEVLNADSRAAWDADRVGSAQCLPPRVHNKET